MIRAAIRGHEPFSTCSLKVYAKGSYANNTNVKADSDVDIAVQCQDVYYWDQADNGFQISIEPYRGEWTPSRLRSELHAALGKKFPNQVDSSGSTAFRVNSSTARVDADVVPCFDYRYYFLPSYYNQGAKVFKVNNDSVVNYPEQQLAKGNSKNLQTNLFYKQAVRIMKLVENQMAAAGIHRELPSFFVECLVYNCPNSLLLRPTWTETIRDVITYIWNNLKEPEPSNESERWLEVSECKFLFHREQVWSRSDGRDFAQAAWNYLGYGV